MTMKRVLIVDDEKPLLLSLQEGFKSFQDQFKVLTVENGQEAVEVLHSKPVDLVVTDLRMPKMNGFQLLTYLKKNFPTIPAIIMTAFNTPVIEQRIHKLGALTLIEKPIDFEDLAQNILLKLNNPEVGARVTGFSLTGFLQLVYMEKKTCVLEVSSSDDKQGNFYFKKGKLFHASYEDLSGEEAATEMLKIEDSEISLQNLPKKKPKTTIQRELMSIIMDCSAIEDDKNKHGNQNKGGEIKKKEERKKSPDKQKTESIKKCIGEKEMTDIKEKLKEFGSLDGFIAVGVFTPQGEMAAQFNPSEMKLNELGAIANEVLLKSQKATDLMGVGRGNMVHIEAPKAQVVARCLNEATDFAASTAGRAHLHMVLIMEQEGSLAMGKMKLEGVIKELAASFR